MEKTSTRRLGSMQTPHVLRLVWRAALVALTLTSLMALPAKASAQMQRMLIGTGCYRLASHATGTIPAYCLDQTGMAPRQGAILGETPALGEATVSIGSESMPLKIALARHLLRVEGSDTHRQLALVNLTGQLMSLCVGRPVVVMGNGMTYSDDLKQIYGKLADAMQHSETTTPPVSTLSTDGDDSNTRVQQRLWTLVNTEDERELSAPLPSQGGPVTSRKDCLAKANAKVPTFILCR